MIIKTYNFPNYIVIILNEKNYIFNQLMKETLKLKFGGFRKTDLVLYRWMQKLYYIFYFLNGIGQTNSVEIIVNFLQTCYNLVLSFMIR